MSFVRDFLCRHAVDLVGKLVHTGFSNGEAQRFLRETPDQVLGVLSECESRPITENTVISGLDVAGLAARSEIEPALANLGLHELVPVLIEFFRESQLGPLSDVRFPTVH